MCLLKPVFKIMFFLQMKPFTSLWIFTLRHTIVSTGPSKVSGDNKGGRSMCLVKPVLPDTLTNFYKCEFSKTRVLYKLTQ